VPTREGKSFGFFFPPSHPQQKRKEKEGDYMQEMPCIHASFAKQSVDVDADPRWGSMPPLAD
jgi:hypothetical protein